LTSRFPEGMTERKAKARTGARFASEKQILRCAQDDKSYAVNFRDSTLDARRRCCGRSVLCCWRWVLWLLGCGDWLGSWSGLGGRDCYSRDGGFCAGFWVGGWEFALGAVDGVVGVGDNGRSEHGHHG
jgi:hypothetical protein